jgi:hypothetical protein
MTQARSCYIQRCECGGDHNNFPPPERERLCEQHKWQQRFADLIETDIFGAGLQVQATLRCA